MVIGDMSHRGFKGAMVTWVGILVTDCWGVLCYQLEGDDVEWSGVSPVILALMLALLVPGVLLFLGEHCLGIFTDYAAIVIPYLIPIKKTQTGVACRGH